MMVDPARALAKARALCAKQERCRSDLFVRLLSWGLDEENTEKIIARLVKDGFLNESRFAEHYAVSKFRQKGWGRVKIRHALKEKRIGDADITAGIKAIDEQEYRSALRALVKKAWTRKKGLEREVREQRVVHYLTGRGFEADLIREALRT